MGLDWQQVLELPDDEYLFALDVIGKADEWRTHDLDYLAAKTAQMTWGSGKK